MYSEISFIKKIPNQNHKNISTYNAHIRKKYQWTYSIFPIFLACLAKIKKYETFQLPLCVCVCENGRDGEERVEKVEECNVK